MQKLAFRFGVNVYGRTEHCGQLAKIVVDPNIWQVTGLVIEDGLIFKRATVLPVAQVEEASGETINLKIPCAQLQEYQAFEEVTVEKGVPTWPTPDTLTGSDQVTLPSANIPQLATVYEKKRMGVNSDAIVLDSSTMVACLEGTVGRLSHILVDANDYLISDLVFRQGKLLPKHYVVPSRDIDALGEAETHIAKTRAEADLLPEYSSPLNEQSQKEGENA